MASLVNIFYCFLFLLSAVSVDFDWLGWGSSCCDCQTFCVPTFICILSFAGDKYTEISWPLWQSTNVMGITIVGILILITAFEPILLCQPEYPVWFPFQEGLFTARTKKGSLKVLAVWSQTSNIVIKKSAEQCKKGKLNTDLGNVGKGIRSSVFHHLVWILSDKKKSVRIWG